MRGAFVNGWAVPAAYTRRCVAPMFGSLVHVIEPNPEVFAALDAVAEDASWLGGYSLGALLLADWKATRQAQIPCLYFAPFGAFPRECGRGGVVELSRLHVLLRQLRRRPVQAVDDFYLRAGLPLKCENEALPASVETLIWGIEQLMVRSAPADGDPASFAYVGSRDPLLDAASLVREWPQLSVLADATHELESLVCAASLPPHVIL